MVYTAGRQRNMVDTTPIDLTGDQEQGRDRFHSGSIPRKRQLPASLLLPHEQLQRQRLRDHDGSTAQPVAIQGANTSSAGPSRVTHGNDPILMEVTHSRPPSLASQAAAGQQQQQQQGVSASYPQHHSMASGGSGVSSGGGSRSGHVTGLPLQTGSGLPFHVAPLQPPQAATNHQQQQQHQQQWEQQQQQRLLSQQHSALPRQLPASLQAAASYYSQQLPQAQHAQHGHDPLAMALQAQQAHGPLAGAQHAPHGHGPLAAALALAQQALGNGGQHSIPSTAHQLLPAQLGHRQLPASLQAVTYQQQQQVYYQQQQQAQRQQQQALPRRVAIIEDDKEENRAALRAVVESLQQGNAKEKDTLPGTMMTPLLRHQKLALGWMTSCEERTGTVRAGPCGGMLCDDQGLGKTISTIALIASDQCSSLGMASAEPAGSSGNSGHDTKQEQQPALSGVSDPSAAAASNSAGAANGSPAAAGISKSSKKGSDAASNLPQGGTLVVCPTSVLNQWEGELRSKLTASAAAALCITKYHGPGRVQDPRLLASFGVVLTTFTTMANEAPEKPDEKQGTSSEYAIDLDDSSDEDGLEDTSSTAAAAAGSSGRGEAGAPPRKRVKRDPLGGPLFRVAWRRVVLDEAQAIKNHRTVVAYAACRLKASRRWCLSGTPIQNSIEDLYSYFRFLQYSPWSSYSYFKSQLKEVVASHPEQGYRKLQAVLKPILLRRTKQSTIEGEPIVQLPARNERLLRAVFSPAEDSYYKELWRQSMAEIKALAQESGGSQRYVNMLVLLLRLRQACNHPWLVRGGTMAFEAHRNDPASQRQAAAARKLGPELRQHLITQLQANIQACGLCGDVGEDPVVSKCGHLFCATCIHMQVDGTTASRAEREVVFHCPLCATPVGQHDVFGQRELAAAQQAQAAAAAAGGAGATVNGAQAGGAAHGGGAQQQHGSLGLSVPGSSRGGPGGGDSTPAAATAAAAAGAGCGGHVAPAPPPAPPGSAQTSAKIDALLEILEAIRQRRPALRGIAAAKSNGSGPSPAPLRSKSALRLTAGLTGGAARRPSALGSSSGGAGGAGGAGSGALASGGVGAASGGALSGSGGAGEKAIVYSQWTHMLNLLEAPLRKHNFTYRRLDGTMTVAKRDEALKEFANDPAVTVLIVSLKAAAVGLNLTCANHVILCDPWWNPTIEEQAIDRAHRIGQTRPVHVTRIVVQGTVEDRILELQQQKRQVVASAFGGIAQGDTSGASNRLTMADLTYLFGGDGASEAAAAIDLT